MSRPIRNTHWPVDGQDDQCLRFEQQLDACLDGRDSMSTLASNPHLRSCDDCQISFDIYQQFDRAGGAVLNGGARTLLTNRKQKSPRSLQRWLPLSSLAVAAALVVFAVVSPPGGQPDNQFAAISSSSDLISETSALAQAKALGFENDVSLQRWNSNDLAGLHATVKPFCEVCTISQRLLSRGLVSSIGGEHESGWEKPWRYTSELPGIRPFHRSVNVALLLYNDSMTLL